MNEVILIGRLTAEIEIRRTADGTAYTFFTLAVNDRLQGEATFIPCSAFNKTAELMEQYLKKGSQIGAKGSVNVLSGKKQNDGTYSQTRVSINVNNITFLDNKENREQQTEAPQTMEEQPMVFKQEPSAFNNNQEEVNANNINLKEIKF